MEPLGPTDVLSYINERIELDERLSDLWVVGEVSDYTRSQQGHRYFSLKDGYSSLRSVMFRTEMPGVDLEPGDSVIAHGRMAVYRQRGDLQFICDFARSAGMGLAAAKFEELRDRLEKDGLFDPARKRRVPAFARRIGVVTSPTGAAIQDIRQVVGRRWPLAELVLAPTMVQGEAAGVRIAAAIEELATEKGLDVAILAREGGQAEDLDGYSDERVARLTFPVVGDPVPQSGPDVAVEAVLRDVEAPADEPAGVGDLPVEYRLPGGGPVDEGGGLTGPEGEAVTRRFVVEGGVRHQGRIGEAGGRGKGPVLVEVVLDGGVARSTFGHWSGSVPQVFAGVCLRRRSPYPRRLRLAAGQQPVGVGGITAGEDRRGPGSARREARPTPAPRRHRAPSDRTGLRLPRLGCGPRSPSGRR